LIIEVAGTQNGAIFGGAIFIIYSFAGIRNGEQISPTPLLFGGKIPVGSKALTPTPTAAEV
jgi:hypothetical protein